MNEAILTTHDPTNRWHAGQILVSCVGLPARGKTHIAHSLERYLKWLGVRTSVFSLSDHRRQVLGDAGKLPKDYFSVDGISEETKKLRSKVQFEMLEKVLGYFQESGGQVAIYDANNGTKAARAQLREFFGAHNVHVMFIESVCDNNAIIEANIRAVKLSSPDYKGWDADKAVADYWKRIKDHERTYETITQPSFPYVKVINVGQTLKINNIEGYLQSRIVFFLMNIHNKKRTIWFARSGISLIEHSYKADSELSEVGEEYAQSLYEYIQHLRAVKAQERKQHPDLCKERSLPLSVWTSSRRRCVGTARPFREAGYRIHERPQMAEINPGVVDNLTQDEIRQIYPAEYARSQAHPYSHRYPRAESYHDLSVRLESAIFELERDQTDLLIIGHASVLRCLFAYLKGLAPGDIPAVGIKRGDLIEITPTAYGVNSKTHTFWRPSEITAIDLQTSAEDPEGAYGSPAIQTVKLADFPLGHITPCKTSRPPSSLSNVVE